MAHYHYTLSGAVTVSERLPHVHLPLRGAVTVEGGARLLVKAGTRLETSRVWIRTAGGLVDAGA